MPQYVQFTAEVGVPIVLEIGNTQGRIPTGITWQFSGGTCPCGGFRGDIHRGEWLDLQTGSTLQVTFVARRGGQEIVEASVIWLLGGGAWLKEEYCWIVTILAPTLMMPEVDPEPLKLERIKGTPAIVGSIDFIFEVDPTGLSPNGQLCAIQLIEGDTAYIQGRDMIRRWTNNEQALDIKEGAQTYLYCNPVPVTGRLETNDSPYTWLPRKFETIIQNDEFVMALVFKSGTHPQACWVPLQYVNWTLTAKVQRIQQEGFQEWQIVTGSQIEIKGMSAPESPGDMIRWTANYQDFPEVVGTIDTDEEDR